MIDFVQFTLYSLSNKISSLSSLVDFFAIHINSSLTLDTLDSYVLLSIIVRALHSRGLPERVNFVNGYNCKSCIKGFVLIFSFHYLQQFNLTFELLSLGLLRREPLFYM